MDKGKRYVYFYPMWRASYQTIYELALDHYGYITTAQAAAVGVSKEALGMMTRRGTLKRVDHGVYRVEAIPPHPRDQYAAAVLWPRGGVEFPIRADVRAGLPPHQVVTAVLSHMTALELHDLSDVNPDKIHLTVPSSLRIRRFIPKLYVLHHAVLSAEEITSIDGLLVTTVVRTIRDCAEAHLGPALLGQAIDQVRLRGMLPTKEIEELERIVFGDQHDSHRRVA